MKTYYDKSVDECLKELEASKNGLTEELATKRLATFGLNKLQEKKGKSKLRRFLEQFSDMMIIILIVVAVVLYVYGFFFTHEYTDPIVITVVVLLNAIMGFIQEEKAQVTLEGLKKYSSSTAKVLRDGTHKVINSEELVPGDIIYLEAGDTSPVDGRIIDYSVLNVDESTLTGESVPVKKTNKQLNSNLPIQEQFNMVFSGCNITNGKATVLVTNTGMDTELGRIAVYLKTPYEVRTPLQIKISELSTKLTYIIFFILIFMFIYGLIKGYEVMEIIMLCVSLAVAAIPEGLPAVITIALSGGAGALAKKKTIVRQMNAVETLGSTDIICSDKTGTITQNKMTVKETDIYNKEMFKYIALLANDTFKDGDKLIGDPTETCLFDYFINLGIDPFEIVNRHPRIMDLPFDSERKMMSSYNDIQGKKYILVKGSIENLLAHCDYIHKDGEKQELTDFITNTILEKEKEYANKALRVLGFAYKEVKKEINDTDDLEPEENNLIYVGMVGIIDPPRDTVIDAVQKCKLAGIRPIMITGDSLVTACAIAHEVGILNNEEAGILGSELDKYTDEELVDIVPKYSVYARVSPDHKVRIIRAWQSQGKVVAMTGDGVNDAPAIKDAHVGVGMGITGTEVTKSVADVILLDDSFSTIVTAVEEGRRIFTNIRNNVVYSLSSNFAEIFVVLVGMFVSKNILLPIHILFIDLVTDSIPSICLSFEGSEKGIMNKPPRGIDKPMFTPFIIGTIGFSAIVEAIFVLVTYFVVLGKYGPEIAATSALLSMVMQEIIFSISCRNLKSLFYKQGIFSNKALNIGLLVLIAIELVFFLTPIGHFISISTMSISLIGIVALFNLLGLLFYELAKPILSKYLKD